ncbi:hypothetical protein ACJIZ3_021705 [Penstemon smallii]|uniref:Uncharacterized protein n=1 Tax=Penstemon smallii TaxID=265156 RepID=A0ABD3SMQ3_9LAMI
MTRIRSILRNLVKTIISDTPSPIINFIKLIVHHISQAIIACIKIIFERTNITCGFREITSVYVFHSFPQGIYRLVVHFSAYIQTFFGRLLCLWILKLLLHDVDHELLDLVCGLRHVCFQELAVLGLLVHRDRD